VEVMKTSIKSLEEEQSVSETDEEKRISRLT
jgi:hypothetical protein